MSAWPDWTGWPAVVVASGASAKKQDLSLLRGRFKIIAVKKSWELIPQADVVYGCDAPWWDSVIGLPKFEGLKLAYDRNAIGKYGIKEIKIPDLRWDDFRFDKVGEVGAGGASGFHATNLAAQFGAKQIILVGMDCSGRPGKEHWYGRNDSYKMGNPTIQQYDRWIKAFDRGARTLQDRGIEVINASFDSGIRAFPKRTIQEAIGKFCPD